MVDLSKYQPQWINIADINLANTALMFRKDLNVADLVGSMRADGQKFPVILWKRAPALGEASPQRGGELHIISGFRRVTATKELGCDTVHAIVIPESDLPEDEALKLNFEENVAKKSLNNLDIMYACKKLSDQGRSNREIGKLIGKSEGQVRRYLKVAGAPPDIQAKVQSGEKSIRSIEDSTAEKGCVARDAAAINNKNCFVKSTNNGFDAVLRYRINNDDPAVVKNHINDMKKALKQVLKAGKGGHELNRLNTSAAKGTDSSQQSAVRNGEIASPSAHNEIIAGREKDRSLHSERVPQSSLPGSKQVSKTKITSDALMPTPGVDTIGASLPTVEAGFAKDKGENKTRTKAPSPQFSSSLAGSVQRPTLKEGEEVKTAGRASFTPSILTGEGRDEGENKAKTKAPSPQSSPTRGEEVKTCRPTIADIKALKAMMGKSPKRKVSDKSQLEGLQKQMDLFENDK